MNEGFSQTQTVAPSHQPAAPSNSLMPDYIGPYRIIEEIASGGMGTVYLAVRKLDERVRKVVALKTIHPHLAKQQGFVQMFLDEASIAARISHPNAATIVDFGEAGGRFYLAMEYLHGEPFDVVLERLKASPELRRGPNYALLIAHVVAEASEGIHALHELRGADGELLDAVHRDVSPHNILVGYDGRVTVLDFGVARSKDKVHQTETGEIRGKVAYISPEQMHGDRADRRSDIWSLGVVLWEALALRSLFRRPTPVDTILAVRGAPIDPVSDYNPWIDPDLETVLGAALRREVEGRPDTARDFAHALRVIASRGPGRAGLASLMGALFPDGERSHRERLVRAESTSIRPARALRPRRLSIVAALTAAAFAGGLGIFFASTSTEPTGSGPITPRPGTSSEQPPAATVGFADNPVFVDPLPALTEDAGQGAHSPPDDELPETTSKDASQAGEQPEQKKPRRIRAYARKKLAANGKLNLVTPGGWAVVLDAKGKRLGRTPLSTNLSAGPHRLTLVPFGDVSKKRKVTVRITAGEATRTAIKLTP